MKNLLITNHRYVLNITFLCNNQNHTFWSCTNNKNYVGCCIYTSSEEWCHLLKSHLTLSCYREKYLPEQTKMTIVLTISTCSTNKIRSNFFIFDIISIFVLEFFSIFLHCFLLYLCHTTILLQIFSIQLNWSNCFENFSLEDKLEDFVEQAVELQGLNQETENLFHSLQVNLFKVSFSLGQKYPVRDPIFFHRVRHPLKLKFDFLW